MTNNFITERDLKKIEDKSVNVLIIGKNPRENNELKKTLTKVDDTEFRVKTVDQLSDGIGHIKKGNIDVVLSDLSLSDSEGINTFERLYEKVPNLPIIVIADKVDQSVAAKAVRRGARDYLVKGQTDTHNLVRSIFHAIEHSRAEEALKDSEEFARNIINSSLDMIIAVDNDRKIKQFNQAAQEIFGYHPDEVLGKHVDTLYANPEKGLEVHNTAVDQGHIVQEIYNRRKNGEVFPSLLSASRIFNSKGERVGVMGISRDITEKKEAEKALLESEERYQNLFSGIPIGLYQTTPEGQLLEVNPSLVEILGYPDKKSLLQMNVTDLYIRKRDRKEWLRKIENEGIIRDFDAQFKKYDGTKIWMRDAVRAVKENGKILYYEGGLKDITQHKKAVTALLEAKKRAEASDRLKNIFLSTISHELRTPLNVILGYGDLLSTELSADINKEIKEMVDSIQGSGKRLKSLIEDILDISLIEANQLELDLDWIYGDELTQKSIDEIYVIAREKNLKVDKNFSAPNAQIKVDRPRLQQAIGNILQNAVKYTNEGTILITTEMIDSEYQISVTDTGIGIKDEFKPHIFALFRQEDEGYSRGYEGAGLGLSISHRLVTAMGGRIEVESEKGRGSTFKLILPARMKVKTEVKKAELETVELDSLQSLVEKKVTKDRILIVEDNPPNMKYLEFLLKRLGLDYISAVSGEKALDLLKDQTVSCMLIDVSLSDGMSGIEFLKTVKKEKKFQKIPKVAVTAHAMKGQREKCLKDGFDDYMAKPFTFADLKEMLNRNL